PPHIELHVRHERCNTSDFEELSGWVSDGIVSMVSFNDHTPDAVATDAGLSHVQVARSRVDGTALQNRLDIAVSQRQVGLDHELALAEVAERVGCVKASHDPSSDSDLLRDLELGVAIAEFPLSIALAHRYRRSGVAVLLGAPNLVRGESHLGNLSVRDAVAAGVDPLLCSDYHYPSLLQAPFEIADAGLASFGGAWSLVSSGPATAARLHDRGRIEAGARADLVVVAPPREGRSAMVSAVIVDGDLVYERR
ncbi:MAG: amidohydrolase family protein, partial [Acidobacteria bacterium]|nr:amidohydrolase family protein [Acidobacteriota bacterium]